MIVILIIAGVTLRAGDVDALRKKTSVKFIKKPTF